jgi:hypothetical protein
MKIENLTEVESSNIAAVGYKDGFLHVRFQNGATYEYENVPDDVATALFEAESVGRFFNGAIRGQYQAVKLPVEEDDAGD